MALFHFTGADLRLISQAISHEAFKRSSCITSKMVGIGISKNVDTVKGQRYAHSKHLHRKTSSFVSEFVLKLQKALKTCAVNSKNMYAFFEYTWCH